jgi:hypothetical protein
MSENTILSNTNDTLSLVKNEENAIIKNEVIKNEDKELSEDNIEEDNEDNIEEDNEDNIEDNIEEDNEDNIEEDNEDEEDEDDEDDIDIDLNFTENSELYIVSVNNSPSFYVKDLKTAKDKMWEVSKCLLNEEYLKGYRTYNLRISDNEIHIIGNHRFFLISYDQILHRISYNKIKECV